MLEDVHALEQQAGAGFADQQEQGEQLAQANHLVGVRGRGSGVPEFVECVLTSLNLLDT